ncbi:hypothetical protein COU89_02185 [Candidatus Roizmanbacteria bacterium CG10_big_fil_rev_8_21_14_0_10_45_7]|uniref:Cohesin domain-containing protein n=1 Tax=Candidatus Roizmanbacteria bacterium CG10_big_fil_rev_8_21_14_0_10_45_7 TaxID=1974854 RepID=A0A2M8KUV5_9BACT|nr:MAG: hypothetical protein COU89_02185 [Candidatus Roizmanbacteria bacterium CG10_big_fil_rev_8_21_14_0_10_45_7]
MRSVFLLFVVIGFFLFIVAPSAYATSYTIVGPSGQLVRDQEYDFTVNVNTDGATMTTGTAQVTYQSQYLQYVSTTPGSFFGTVDATPGTGTVQLVGTNTAAKSGSGSFAVIRFKLIADSPGSTELCTVAEVPGTTPTTVVPTTATMSCFDTCTVNGTACPSGMSCVDVNAGTGAASLYRCVLRPGSNCGSSDQACWCGNPTATPAAIAASGITTGMIIGASAFVLISIGLLTLFVL